MRLIFKPDKPSKSNKFNDLQNDIKDIKGKDIIVCYDNSPTELRPQKEGINHRLKSVRKSYVAKVNEDIDFFTPLTIDSETYDKPFIKKSEKQNSKDVTVFLRNIKPVEGYTCQRLIDSRLGDKYVEYRAIVVFNHILIMTRFKVLPFNYHDGDMEIIYTPEDSLLNAIKKANKYFGLDFGEYDILKDRLGWSIVDLNQCAGNGIYKKPIGKYIRSWIKEKFLDKYGN